MYHTQQGKGKVVPVHAINPYPSNVENKVSS